MLLHFVPHPKHTGASKPRIVPSFTGLHTAIYSDYTLSGQHTVVILLFYKADSQSPFCPCVVAFRAQDDRLAFREVKQGRIVELMLVSSTHADPVVLSDILH